MPAMARRLERRTKRVLERGAISSGAFHSAEAQVYKGWWVFCPNMPDLLLFLGEVEEGRGSRHPPREGTEYFFLPTSVFCHGVWVARASRSIMFQLRG